MSNRGEPYSTVDRSGTEPAAGEGPGVVRAPSLRRSLIRNLTRALLDFEEAGDLAAARVVLSSLNRVFGLDEETRAGEPRAEADADAGEGS